MQPVVRLNANEMLKRFNERDLSGSMNPMSIERPKAKRKWFANERTRRISVKIFVRTLGKLHKSGGFSALAFTVVNCKISRLLNRKLRFGSRFSTKKKNVAIRKLLIKLLILMSLAFF